MRVCGPAPRVLLALLLLLLLAASTPPAAALQNGAPEGSCVSLLPKHGNTPPQTGPPPFQLVLARTRVGRGEPLRLMLTSREGFGFKGFILQARAPASQEALGTFTAPDGLAKTIACGGEESTVTHTHPATKKSLEFQWQSPPGYEGVVIFNATVVQDYSTFWNNITTSAELSDSVPTESPGISTTHPPVTTLRTSTTNEPVTFTPEPKPTRLVEDIVYTGCGETKTCFGFPNNCLNSQTCRGIVTINVRGKVFEFEMMASNAVYVAVGLSDDSLMGNDYVVECVYESNQERVRLYQSWNPGKSNNRLQTVKNVTLQSSSYDNNAVKCKFSHDEVTQVNDRTYNFSNQKYFLLLASGKTLKENGVGYHGEDKTATEKSIYLPEIDNLKASSKLLIKLHGAFMIGAWIGAASIGIVLARYFKQTWTGRQICGKDLWFAWHRMFMLIAWGLTIVAFVLIFVELKDWSHEENPHAILGVLTTALAFFQPILAAFRPRPDSRRRPIFNWLHWLIGNCAHIVAIVSIFFAGKLTKADLPSWWIWILVGFVAFHVLMHLILSVAGCVSERHSGTRINSFPMKEMSNSRTPLSSADRNQEAPHSCFRKFLLAVYILGILTLTVAIIVIIVWAPIESNIKRLKNYIANTTST